MRGPAVAALLLVSLAATPGTAAFAARVPGTALRWGLAPDRLDSTFVAVAGDSTARSGVLPFFGVPAHATLRFPDGRLSAAEFAADSVSPAAASYMEDELAREGYRRRCMRWDDEAHVCDWSGPVAELHLEVLKASVRATVRAAVPEVRPAIIAAPSAPQNPPSSSNPRTVSRPDRDWRASDSVTVDPDDLPVDVITKLHQEAAGNSGAWVRDSCHVGRPEAARRAGVFGSVDVEVRVDSTGVVQHARVLKGIPELNQAALDCARQYRFGPPMENGRRRSFSYLLTIRFAR